MVKWERGTQRTHATRDPADHLITTAIDIEWVIAIMVNV